jgi:light-regulated signal transduction histidine kinase (bacteriophytochrome)
LSNHEAERIRYELAQANEETFQFLRAAVHDLRSEQRGVCASAELLQDLLADSLPPEARPIFTRLRGSAVKTTAILAGASQYAAALSAARYRFHQVELSSIVRQSLASLEPDLRASGAAISVGELPRVWGDRDRLTELFRHLLDNALKYHGPLPPAIEIEAAIKPDTLPPDQCLIQVRDHGIGIDPKYHRELFRPFRRLHGPEIPGLGLGLCICKRIVESHGGRLWVESDAGKGTTVSFTLTASD